MGPFFDRILFGKFQNGEKGTLSMLLIFKGLREFFIFEN
jgi:hypothetical protein